MDRSQLQPVLAVCALTEHDQLQGQRWPWVRIGQRQPGRGTELTRKMGEAEGGQWQTRMTPPQERLTWRRFGPRHQHRESGALGGPARRRVLRWPSLTAALLSSGQILCYFLVLLPKGQVGSGRVSGNKNQEHQLAPPRAFSTVRKVEREIKINS